MKVNKKFLLINVILVLFAAMMYAESIKIMYVSVGKASVKAKSSILSQEIAELHYGDQVVLKRMDSSWAKVEGINKEFTGWIPLSSITHKKLSQGTSRITTDVDEISLAGKGFSASIEAEYEKEYELPYDEVDKMEENLVTQEETIQFMKEGKLLLEGKRL